MKRVLLALTLCVASPALVACGGSFCQRMADSSKRLVQKTEACDFGEGIEFEEPTDAEIEQCEAQFAECSDADKKLLNDMVTCIDNLKTCEAGGEQSFSLNTMACITPLQNLSEGCQGAAL